MKDLVGFIPEFPDSDALALFKEFNKDEQDSVRLMSIENLLALNKVTPKSVSGIVNELVKGWAADKSWRIRYMMTDKICELARISETDYVSTELLEYMIGFMGDPETEVRAIAAAKTREFIALVNSEEILKLLGGLKKMAADAQVHVRSI